MIYRFVLPICSAVAFTSCTLVAPYDPVIDKNINEISVKTETALVKADRGELNNTEQTSYFSESIGLVRATHLRSSLHPKNEDETATLKDLEDRLEALADRQRPLRSSVATGLKITIAAAQQIEIAKKRSAAFSTSLNKTE